MAQVPSLNGGSLSLMLSTMWNILTSIMALTLSHISGIVTIVDVISGVDASLLFCGGCFFSSFDSPVKSRDDVVVITLCC